MATRLRKAANGQDCSVRIPNICQYSGSSVILAHIRTPGTGVGRKPHDMQAVLACGKCHDAIGDGSEARLERLGYTKYVLRALLVTWATWRDLKLVRVIGDTDQ